MRGYAACGMQRVEELNCCMAIVASSL